MSDIKVTSKVEAKKDVETVEVKKQDMKGFFTARRIYVKSGIKSGNVNAWEPI